MLANITISPSNVTTDIYINGSEEFIHSITNNYAHDVVITFSNTSWFSFSPANFSLLPSQVQNVTFNVTPNATSLGLFNKTVYVFASFLNASNTSQLLTYNRSVTYLITLIYPPTNISAVFFTTNFTVDYNETYDQGVMLIRNDGDVDEAINIHMWSNITELTNNASLTDWLIFEENDFDLDPGEEKIVRFSVRPLGINETHQTNRTYTLPVFIEGDNTNRLEFNLSVRVRHHEFEEIPLEDRFAKIIEELDRFCEEHPDSKLCTRDVIERERIVHVHDKCQVNFTEEDWNAKVQLEKENKNLRARLETCQNNVRDLSVKISEQSGEIAKLRDRIVEINRTADMCVRETKAATKEVVTAKQVETGTNITWIILLVIGIAGFVVFALVKPLIEEAL